MTTEARNRLNIRTYGYLHSAPDAQAWRKAQRAHFRAKRRAETRAWAVQVFKAFALVLAAVAGFCSATFGSAR